jgi:hypothetical protein
MEAIIYIEKEESEGSAFYQELEEWLLTTCWVL